MSKNENNEEVNIYDEEDGQRSFVNPTSHSKISDSVENHIPDAEVSDGRELHTKIIIDGVEHEGDATYRPKATFKETPTDTPLNMTDSGVNSTSEVTPKQTLSSMQVGEPEHSTGVPLEGVNLSEARTDIPQANGGVPVNHIHLEAPRETSKTNLGYGIILGMICALFCGFLIYNAYQNAKLSDKIVELETRIGANDVIDNSKTEVVYKDNGDISTLVETIMPSIVAINVTGTVEYYSFFGAQRYKAQGAGSGIIINKTEDKLYIATNNHVVESAEDVSVQFIDGSSVKAEVNGNSSDTDVAVVTVALKDISESTLGKIRIADLNTDKETLHVGNKVVAIGNALGYGQSVTVGYISALNRSITAEDGVRDGLIQTDAAINPGNSGGALVDMNGRVIGINVAKYSSVDIEGVGYSIPISDVNEIIDLLSTEKVPVDNRGSLGIQYRDIDAKTSALYGWPQGVLVTKITNEALSEAGLREQDIIVKFNEKQVLTGANLVNLLEYYKNGDEVTLTIKRLVDGAYIDIEIKTVLIENVRKEADKEDKGTKGEGSSKTEEPSSSDVPESGKSDSDSQQSPINELTPEELDELYKLFQYYYGIGQMMP